LACPDASGGDAQVCAVGSDHDFADIDVVGLFDRERHRPGDGIRWHV
jgi:hypothetical protein